MSATTELCWTPPAVEQAVNFGTGSTPWAAALVCAVALGAWASVACAAPPSSPPVEVITLSDKVGLMPAEVSAADKSLDAKPASSMSSSLRAGSANKEVHAGSGAPHADAPFPHQKAPTQASPAPAEEKAAAHSPSTGVYLVKRGDTLDKVVQKALGDSPLKSELLKRELVALNPEAFTKGSQKILKSGVLLKLPNNDDLLRSQLGQGQTSSAQGSYKQFVGYETYPDVIINPQGQEKRKTWVQYP